MTRYRRQHALFYRSKVMIDDKGKEVIDFVQKGYDKAEEEVDGWFARNKHTVAILSGVAVGIVLLVIAVLALL